MIFAAALRILRLVLEGVERVVSSMHGISQQAQLLEHGLICDLPSHSLLNDDLRPEESPL